MLSVTVVKRSISPRIIRELNDPDANRLNLTDVVVFAKFPKTYLGAEEMGKWQNVIDFTGKADTWNDRANAAAYVLGFFTGDSKLDFSSPEAAVGSLLDISFVGVVTWSGVGDAFPSLNPQ